MKCPECGYDNNPEEVKQRLNGHSCVMCGYDFKPKSPESQALEKLNAFARKMKVR